MKTQHQRLRDEATQRTTHPSLSIEDVRRLVPAWSTLKNAGTNVLREAIENEEGE